MACLCHLYSAGSTSKTFGRHCANVEKVFCVCNSHFNPILYSRFLGKAAVNHTRMRLGLSALNSQRYKYNIVPSPSCERCGASKEDPYHIFFVCPAYAVPRQTLTQDLNRILSVEILQKKKQVEIIFRNLRPPYQPHTIYNIARFYIFLWQIFLTIFNILSSSQLIHSSNSYIYHLIVSYFSCIFFHVFFFPFFVSLTMSRRATCGNFCCNSFVK